MKIERKAKKATERFGVMLIWASGICNLKTTSFSQRMAETNFGALCLRHSTLSEGAQEKNGLKADNQMRMPAKLSCKGTIGSGGVAELFSLVLRHL